MSSFTSLDDKAISQSDPYLKTYELSMFEDFASLNGTFVAKTTPIRILRNTSACNICITIVFRDFLNSNVLIQDKESGYFVPVPHHKLYLTSDPVNGHVTVSVRSHSLLKVFIHCLTNYPLMDQNFLRRNA